jgi:hypothetical protein
MILDMKGGAISIPPSAHRGLIDAHPYGRTRLRPTPQSAAEGSPDHFPLDAESFFSRGGLSQEMLRRFSHHIQIFQRPITDVIAAVSRGFPLFLEKTVKTALALITTSRCGKIRILLSEPLSPANRKKRIPPDCYAKSL